MRHLLPQLTSDAQFALFKAALSAKGLTEELTWLRRTHRLFADVTTDMVVVGYERASEHLHSIAQSIDAGFEVGVPPRLPQGPVRSYVLQRLVAWTARRSGPKLQGELHAYGLALDPRTRGLSPAAGQGMPLKEAM